MVSKMTTSQYLISMTTPNNYSYLFKHMLNISCQQTDKFGCDRAQDLKHSTNPSLEQNFGCGTILTHFSQMKAISAIYCLDFFNIYLVNINK